MLTMPQILSAHSNTGARGLDPVVDETWGRRRLFRDRPRRARPGQRVTDVARTVMEDPQDVAGRDLVADLLQDLDADPGVDVVLLALPARSQAHRRQADGAGIACRHVAPGLSPDGGLL